MQTHESFKEVGIYNQPHSIQNIIWTSQIKTEEDPVNLDGGWRKVQLRKHIYLPPIFFFLLLNKFVYNYEISSSIMNMVFDLNK